MRAYAAPWIAIDITSCAVFGCKEPRCFQEADSRFVAKDNPEEIARRFCIRHAFEYDRERVNGEPAEVVVLLFQKRAA